MPLNRHACRWSPNAETSLGAAGRSACATSALPILLALVLAASLRAEDRLKVLAVVAHPDDEYAFAATTYRIARELGGIVDQVVISNGEAGYRYSVLAEKVYGLHLTDETIGRENLPEIRKQESLAAGRILGIRQHHFLDQKDAAFTLNVEEAASAWDRQVVRAFLSKLLREEGYGFVFTLLPAAGTHGEHKAATILALEAVQLLPEGRRPVVFGVEAEVNHESAGFVELAGYPVTRAGTDLYEFQRLRAFGFRDALNYEIIANWVIAAHKSQGLFQMDAGRHNFGKILAVRGERWAIPRKPRKGFLIGFSRGRRGLRNRLRRAGVRSADDGFVVALPCGRGSVGLL